MIKTKIKPICLWGLAAVLVLSAVYCLLRFGFQIDIFDRGGWYEDGSELYYRDYYGRPLTGWQDIGEDRYYFDPDGAVMVTGWRRIDGSQYYFREDGSCSKGWLSLKEDRYYFGDDGAMITGFYRFDDGTCYFSPDDGSLTVGWLIKDGQRMYFTEDGFLCTGWMELNGQRMHFSEEGVLQTGWLDLDEKRYYLNENGVAVSGWVELDDVRYRFNEDGSVVTGWFSDDTGRYFFSEDGSPANGWLDWEQKRYYLQEDGSVTTGWLTLEGERYYFLPSGRMAIGEIEIDGITRFFTSTGREVLLCNPWHAIPDDYELDLVPCLGYKMQRCAAEPLERMMSDCVAAGIDCRINNTYRSTALQRMMWNNRVSERMASGMTREQAEALTGTSLAIPGHSEHESGLALDVEDGNGVYQWFNENCWDYGFIVRYPEGTTDLTGIIYEPWHFRYVGTELSMELKELGLCMEEYMHMLTQQQQNIPD